MVESKEERLFIQCHTNLHQAIYQLEIGNLQAVDEWVIRFLKAKKQLNSLMEKEGR